jgi:hypothetical protein
MADMKERDRIKPQAAAANAPADQFDRDLNPNGMAGQNIGAAGAQPHQARTARDVKDVHALLRDWSDDDLDEVPIVPAGSRLEQNATYLDLAASQPREFTATANMMATPQQRLVEKSTVPYQIWNRLRGVTDVQRTERRE